MLSNGLLQKIGNVEDGGTVTGDLRIEGDLTVVGSSTYVYDQSVEGGLVIDTTEAEAFLVRKSGDSGDVFSINSSTDIVRVHSHNGSTTGLQLGGTLVTSSATELNILDGATLSTTELNYVDGVTSAIQTQIDTKAPTASPTFTGTITIGSAEISETELEILDGLTVTTAEVNVLDGITSTTAELNYLDITTLGTLEASKALTADASGNINFNNGNMTNVDIDSGAIDGTNITVGAGKTLDVSAGTLTLAANQISGDKIDGGTISTFASTGIDDNASSNALTIDSSQNLALTSGDLEVYSTIKTGAGNRDITLTPHGTGDVIVSSGNVGVGTSSPATNLHLQSSDTNIIRIEDTSSDGIAKLELKNDARTSTFGLFGDDSDSLKIHHGGNYVFSIDTSGNSTFAGNVTVSDRVVGSGDLILVTTDSNEKIHMDSDGYMKFETAGSERMRILSGGNVCIGGTSDEGYNTLLNIEGAGGTDDVPGILFKNTSASNDEDIMALIASQGTDSVGAINIKREGNADDAYIDFLTQANSGSMAERMRITSTGNVGIGTTSPSLQQISNATVLNVHTSTANTRSILELSSGTNNDDTHVGSVFFSNSENADGSNMDADGKLISAITVLTETSDSNGGDDSGGHLAIFTKPEAGSLTERMRIDSSGYVGIGLTDPNNHFMVGGSSGGDIAVARTDTTINDGDTLGNILFKGKDDGGSGVYGIGAKITALATEAWNEATAEGTSLNFYTTDNTTATNDLRMTIDDNGKVGIGESSPSELMHISGGNLRLDHTRPMIQFEETDGTADQNWQLDMAAGVFRFQTNNDAFSSASTKLSIDQSGNVGIGTDSPDDKLHVVGNIFITDGSPEITFETTNSSHYNWQIAAQESVTQTLEFSVGSQDADASNDSFTPKMVINSDGEVGIGSSSPISVLEVKGTNSALDGVNTGLVVHDSGSANAGLQLINNSGKFAMYADGSNDRVDFYIDDATTGSSFASGDRIMTLKYGGHVGVGIDTPVSTMHIYEDSTAVDSTAGLTIEQAGTGDAIIQFLETGTQRWVVGLDNSDSDKFKISSDGDLNSNARLTIDTSGNVGIGTDSPANESSGTLLHIADTGGTNAAHINLSGGTGGDGNQTGKISFSDPGDTDDAVAFISCNVEGTDTNPGGSLHFFTAPDAGSPTERVTIHEDGNVGIGTDSPSDYNALAHNLVVYENSNSGITIGSSTSGTGSLYFADGTSGDEAYKGSIEYSHSSNALSLRANSVVRFVIDPNSRISLSNNDSGGTGGSDSLSANTFLGYLAGQDIASGGVDNTYFGHKAGSNNATGDDNVFIGSNAGKGSHGNSNSNNVGIGSDCMLAVTTGNWNTVMGQGAGASITDGHENVIIGQEAGDVTTSVGYSVMVGAAACGNGNVTSAADGTVAVGYASLKALTSGGKNTAIGYEAANDLTTGQENIAIGYQALDAAAVGESYNVAIGVDAMGAVDEGTAGGDADKNIAIGYNALLGGDFAGNDRQLQGNIAIGHQALDATSTNSMTGTIAIGHQALSGITTGSSNTAIGYQAMAVADGGEGSNTAVGYQALSSLNSDGADENTCIGNIAGTALTTGSDNTLIGSEAAASAVGASNQIVIGKSATGQADNSVTLGNADVTAVYMAQDSGATVYCATAMVGLSGTANSGNIVVNEGIYIAANNGDNQIRANSAGAGSTTLYIGNQSITTSSDVRIKENIVNTEVNALSKLNDLRVVDFTWNDTSDVSYNNRNARGKWTGLIAQEVIDHIPYVVNAVRDKETLDPIPDAKNEDGENRLWGMEYDKLVPILIKAVQELSAKVEALENK